MHLDKPGSWGAYWLSDASTSNQNQAAAFTFQVTTINEVMPGYTKSAINANVQCTAFALFTWAISLQFGGI